MSSSKILPFFLLSFIGGIFIASFLKVPALIIYELILLGVFYALLAAGWQRQGRAFRLALAVFAICFLILALGIWQGSKAGPLPYQSSTGVKLLSGLKAKLQATIDQNLSPPQNGLLSAILLGNKEKMSKEFKEKLNIAGIRHVTAISGMHIVILSGLLLWLGISLGLWRQQAFYFAIGFLWLFILMIGFQPSAIRAGIMGSMFLFCEKIGRQKTADRALLLTAAVMLAINPSLLRYSIGFQLSFLATLGIIYLMKPIQSLLKSMFGCRTPKHWSSGLLSLISMSFAAQIFVLPLLIYHFGQFSIISPLTNLLVVPLLPYLMGAGFLFVMLGAIWWPLGFILLFPVWLMLTYISKLTNFFASLSFSALNFQLHWLWLPLIYGALALIIWQIKTRQKSKLLP